MNNYVVRLTYQSSDGEVPVARYIISRRLLLLSKVGRQAYQVLRDPNVKLMQIQKRYEDFPYLTTLRFSMSNLPLSKTRGIIIQDLRSL